MKKSNGSDTKTTKIPMISSGRPLEKLYAGKKLGIWISVAISVITLLILLFTKLIYISENAGLLEKLKISVTDNGIDGSYSTFNLLKFVEISGLGKIGFYSMILLLLSVATIYFIVAYLIRGLKVKHNNIPSYETGQYVMVFTIILYGAMIIFQSYANNKLGTPNFIRVSPLAYLMIILAIIGFVVIKMIEAPERQFYKQHGFFVEVKRNWVLFAMLIPAFIYFALNNYLPMFGVYFAFEKFNFRDGLWDSPFVAFANFEHLWKANLMLLTKNTVLYNVAFIGIGNVLQIFMAILISQISSRWFKKVSQTLMFMPYFVSFVILNVLVYNLLNYEVGAINNVITSLGFKRIDFYNKPGYWPVLITIFQVWKNLGYGMVVYLATILGINREYYEAAEVDGASIIQQIRYITLPQIKPTFIILLLFALGGIMKGQFELFYQMVGNNGVLFNVTDIFDTYVYRVTTTNPLSNGVGTAAGLYQSIFGFIVIMITNFLVKRKNSEYALF